jgi:hypothetical protein
LAQKLLYIYIYIYIFSRIDLLLTTKLSSFFKFFSPENKLPAAQASPVSIVYPNSLPKNLSQKSQSWPGVLALLVVALFTYVKTVSQRLMGPFYGLARVFIGQSSGHKLDRQNLKLLSAGRDLGYEYDSRPMVYKKSTGLVGKYLNHLGYNICAIGKLAQQLQYIYIYIYIYSQ